MSLLILAAKILSQAAAALPIIALLALLAGRRGNGALCLNGAIWLTGAGLILAAAGPVWLGCGYLQAAMAYTKDPAALFAPLFKAAGLPWSSSLLAWLAGWLALFTGLNLLQGFRGRQQGESYAPRLVAGPISMLFLAAIGFFCAFFLINWPFAGLPAGLGWDRAAMAIARHANSEYFRGFGSAGAICLSLWPLWRSRIPAHYMPTATRWLSFWALAGNLPWLLASLGPALGAVANNANMAAAYGIKRQLIGFALFVAAAAIWGVLLWRPQLLARLAWPALMLFACASLAPAILP